MLNDLLTLDNYIMPESASFDISPVDKKNEFQSENGKRTIEYIRQGVTNISVSYGGLTEEKLIEINKIISKRIVSVTFHNPLSSTQKTIKAEITGVKSNRKYYKNGLSVWGLSFEIQEL